MIPGVLGTEVIRMYCMFRSSSSTQVIKRNTQINNRKLVQFTFSRAIKADKKRKMKLKTINA